MAFMMRNTVTAFVLIFILTILMGCSTADKSDDEFNFSAKVLQIDNNIITVEPLEGEDILRSADRITFSKDDLNDIAVSFGDIVAITFTGDIMESYPAQINAISWSKSNATINTKPILNSYYAAQKSQAFEMFKKKVFENLADDWTDEISDIENPVWNYDSFTEYQILDQNMLSVSRYEELYYCTFSADNDKFGYIVASYDGSSLKKISGAETPYLYDLRPNMDEIAYRLSEAEIDLSSAVASRVRLVDTDRNRSDEIILFTDDSGSNYACYLDDSFFELVKLP